MCEKCIFSRHGNFFLRDHGESEERISKHDNACENLTEVLEDDISVASDTAEINESNSADGDSQTEVGLNLPPTNVNPNASLNVDPNVNPLLDNNTSQTVDRSNLDQTIGDRNRHLNDAKRTATVSDQTDLVENPPKTPKNSVMIASSIYRGFVLMVLKGDLYIPTFAVNILKVDYLVVILETVTNITILYFATIP